MRELGAAQEGAWCCRPGGPCSGLWVVCGKAFAVGPALVPAHCTQHPEKSQRAAAESLGFSSFQKIESGEEAAVAW